MPIGVTFPVGWIAHCKEPAATFGLQVGKVDLEGE
jgi:hypothetical protein